MAHVAESKFASLAGLLYTLALAIQGRSIVAISWG